MKTLKTNPIIRKLTASATAQQLCQKNPNRVGLMVFNNEAANIPEVTSNKADPYGKGVPIPPQRSYENLHYCQGEYFIVCDTGETADLRIEEDIREPEG